MLKFIRRIFLFFANGEAARGQPSNYLLYNNSVGMSKERRRFLIVNVFDFAFITLLWLLNVVTKGHEGEPDLAAIFINEMNIFSKKFLSTSLFDLELMAFFRMVSLLFFYAWIKCDHWLPVAFTTSASTIYVGVKIVLFFNKSVGSMQQLLMIIASMAIAWFELWLMPFRVLPVENQRIDQSAETSTTYAGISVADTETQRIFQEVIRDEEFLTALEQSSDENEERAHRRPGKISRQQYVQVAKNALKEGEKLLHGVDTWKVLYQKDSTEVRVREGTNSYYVKFELEFPAAAVFDAVWKNSEKWNKQIVESNVLTRFNPSTDLIMYITAAACGGYIASRYFIDVRHFVHIPEIGSYIGVYTSLDDKNLTYHLARFNINCSQIRGKNGVNVIKVSSKRSDSGNFSSLFQWIMNTDLQGHIPKVLIRRTICSFMINYSKELHNYISSQIS